MKFGLPVWHGNIDSIESEVERAGSLGFDYVEISLDYPWPDLLSKREIAKILSASKKAEVSFAFHAPPEGVGIGSPFARERKESALFLISLMKWSSKFKPVYFNFHGFFGDEIDPSENEVVLGAVLASTRKSIRELKAAGKKIGVVPTFENTPDPVFGISGNIDFILEGSKGKFCLDAGHSEIINGISRQVLGKEDRSLRSWGKKWGTSILTVHLHNVKKGVDHYPFSEKDVLLGQSYSFLSRKTCAKFTTIEVMKEKSGPVKKVSDRTFEKCLRTAKLWAGEERR